jgi:hypothetical protein
MQRFMGPTHTHPQRRTQWGSRVSPFAVPAFGAPGAHDDVRTIGLSLLILASGCAKNVAASAPPGADYAPADSAGSEAAYDAEREVTRWEDADDGVTATGVVASPAATPVEAEPADDKPPQRDELDGRAIIYTGAMTVSVFNLEDAMAKAEALPETHGGYVQSMTAGVIVLRIPAKTLKPVMNAVAELGVVDSRSLQTADVTAEYTDMDSRIRALEETQKQLLELLTKARTVEEALKVRSALDQINGELEVLKGRMRQMKNRISYSTLTLNLYERGPHTPTPSSNDPFPWVNNLGVESTEWK